MWKIESADAPGVAAMISGVREMVSSAAISSSSMFQCEGSNGGCDCCRPALRGNPRSVFSSEESLEI